MEIFENKVEITFIIRSLFMSFLFSEGYRIYNTMFCFFVAVRHTLDKYQTVRYPLKEGVHVSDYYG